MALGSWLAVNYLKRKKKFSPTNRPKFEKSVEDKQTIFFFGLILKSIFYILNLPI